MYGAESEKVAMAKVLSRSNKGNKEKVSPPNKWWFVWLQRQNNWHYHRILKLDIYWEAVINSAGLSDKIFRFKFHKSI